MVHYSQQRSPDAVDILLVEDNPGDVRLIEEAFEETDTETRVHAVTDGREAIELVTDESAAGLPSIPDLALIDLNLPQKDGCEVLEAIRGEPRFRGLPVVILTNSESSEDITRCYDARANAYLTKPVDPDEFVSLVQTVEQFWFEQAQLPPIPS